MVAVPGRKSGVGKKNKWMVDEDKLALQHQDNKAVSAFRSLPSYSG